MGAASAGWREATRRRMVARTETAEKRTIVQVWVRERLCDDVKWEREAENVDLRRERKEEEVGRGQRGWERKERKGKGRKELLLLFLTRNNKETDQMYADALYYFSAAHS
jgi:hypothetical protein